MGSSESKDEQIYALVFWESGRAFLEMGCYLFSYFQINDFWPWPPVGMSFSLLL